MPHHRPLWRTTSSLVAPHSARPPFLFIMKTAEARKGGSILYSPPGGRTGLTTASHCKSGPPAAEMHTGNCEPRLGDGEKRLRKRRKWWKAAGSGDDPGRQNSSEKEKKNPKLLTLEEEGKWSPHKWPRGRRNVATSLLQAWRDP